MHGHGGIVLVMLAHIVLHNDIGCSYDPNTFGERFHWYSSTGWVMWNAQMAGLLGGTTCCIYDGNPGGAKDAPDWSTLWRFAAELGVTFFGAGAAFFANCMKAGVDLASMPRPAQRARARHHRLAAVGGGAALGHARSSQRWARRTSGGATSPAAPTSPAPSSAATASCRRCPARCSAALLGCAVEAWNEQGQPVIGEVGELVCTRPIPSMPLYFWNDPGNKRYLGPATSTPTPASGATATG